MSDALWRRTASELAELIRSKQVSSREVVEAHLARIDEVNGPVNAVTLTLAESALATAAAADQSEPAGPLHGVPFTIKENLDCVGSPTTQGVPALATGMTPIGLGNDIGGSLRNPAYCCGIASLKPTQGRIPCVLSMGEHSGMSMQAMLSEGPMARSVADLRLGL